ncbi:RNA polymerase sigma factor [Nocardiopsis coralliicola]
MALQCTGSTTGSDQGDPTDIHGYTPDDLLRLARIAAFRYRYACALDIQERKSTAWSAIAEHLMAAAGSPTEKDLLGAAWTAIAEASRKDWSFRGRTIDGPAPGFERFWTLTALPTASPENPVVERRALAQIWRVLTPRHRELILALAEHEDYAAAAASLNLPTSSYYSLLSRARKAFFALWHEHETPTRPWGNDVRSKMGVRHKNVTVIAIRQRERLRSRRPAPKSRRRLRRDLGVTPERLRELHASGVSITALARTYKTTWATIRSRLDLAAQS